MRKIVLFVVLAGFASPLCSQIVCWPFPLSHVRLLPSRFQENMKRDSAWMMSIPANRLLHSFRNTAGVFSSREGGYMTMQKLGGWESLDCDLRGHITGHLLSALASLYAQTGSAEVKAKADSLVNGLNEVQHQYGNGYLSAFGEGLIDRNIQGKSVWAPWYTLHKIVQGLIDQYRLCGNDTALVMAQRMGLWAYRKLKPLDETTRQRMIRNEFGGFNEAMYELYRLTVAATFPDSSRKSGNLPRHFPEKEETTVSPPWEGAGEVSPFLWLARFFYHHDKVDPLKNGNRDLGTAHANTFIPKLLGEAENYEIFGDQSSRRAAELLFRTLTQEHAFVTGEVSDKEHLFNPSAQSQHLTGYDGENCCTFNLLKLAGHVFSWSASEDVAEYYERALYNHILGQQDPATSMVTYFTPLQTGTYRLYSTRDSSFWCCVGSGFESHVKYASGIYFRAMHDLWVNLFIPSTVDWDGTVIRQTTDFPASGTVTLSVSGRNRAFTLHLRYPSWATGMAIRVNGRRISLKGGRGKYVSLKRKWKAGDRVEVTYGMALREEATRDDSSRVAVLYGPIVLAGELGRVEHPFSDPKKYNDYYTFDFEIPDSCAARASYHSLKDFRQTASLQFRSPSGLTVRPFFDVHHERYVVYWRKL